MTKQFQLLILKLFKIKILLTFFVILFSLPLKAENNKKPCFKNTDFNTNELELPYKISVKVNKNKTFQINNLKIITSEGLIKKRFKKRFSGKVKLFYNDKICEFKATIRVHGDFKDHVKFVKCNINLSLDIHLKEGME